MESKKRKRDDKAQSNDGRDDAHLPRITYHAVHKSFDRLFKEGSLEETKRVVRHKLKLASDADVGLEQWREGRLIDLEDDEDFAAFGALARTVPSLEVRVTVDGEGPSMATSTPAPKKQQKKRSSSVPPPISIPEQQHRGPDDPNPPLSKAASKLKKRRMSVSGPTVDLPPPPLALPHAEPASLLALLKSKSKTKRKFRTDEEAHSFDPKAKVNAKAGPSTEPLSASGMAEPSTKKRKMNDGQGKGVVEKPVSQLGAQVEGQDLVKKKRKDKAKAKANNLDMDMDMGPMAVDATEVSVKTKDKKEKMNKKLSHSSSTSFADGHRAGTSRAPLVDGSHVQDVEMGEEAPMTSKSKSKKAEKEKKEKGKAKKNEKIPEADSQPLKKKPEPKKSVTSAKMPTELASVVATPSPAENPTVVDEFSSTAVSKIKKTKPKPKASKGKDKELSEQEQGLGLERKQAQQIEAHMKFAENLAGVTSILTDTFLEAKSSLGLSLDGSETGRDVNGAGADANGVRPKSKKESKKDFAGAGERPAASSHLVETAPKPKKRRKSTSTGEDLEVSAIRPVNATKTTKAKSKKRQSENPKSDMPVDDEGEVAKAPSNAKKPRVRPPRPVVSANTKEWDAKIMDAIQTVLARNDPTAVSPPLDGTLPSLKPEQSMTTTSDQKENPLESEAEVEAEMSLPGKRQKSQSRLRMSWGPEDFLEDEAEPSTITETVYAEPAPAITRSPLLSSSPTTRRSLASSIRSMPPKGKRLRKPDEFPCPICLQTPFHLRYRCPVIEAGPDVIEKRLNELKEEDTGHHSLLIEELEHVIRNQKTRASLSKSGSFSSPGSFAKSGSHLSPISGASSRRLTVPSGSTMSEVTVENKDEGSSNESSDDEDPDGDNDEDNVAEKQSNPYELPPAFAGMASLADLDLEAIIRGPASQSKSVLDDIPSRSISDDEDEAAEDILEDEEDGDQLYRLRSKKFEKNTSSDENEGEDPTIPLGEGESGEDEMAETSLEPSAQSTRPPEDSSRTTQAVDGSHGFVGIGPMDDDGEQTEVAPSAENGEETDESGLSIRKEKKALLAAVLGVVSFSKGKDASSDAVPRPESPIEETYPQEDAMDIIEPSQLSAKKINKHIDRSDPIEPADDLMDSAPQGEPEDASQSRAVSQSPRKPGMAKRMKTRDGRVPLNLTVDLEANHSPVSTALRGAKAGMRSAEPSPLLGSAVRESARKLPNVEITEDAMPPPPIPAVKGPPRRGRPPLSQEVKAAREKAKADNKAQKANEKARKTGAKQVQKDEQVSQRVGQHDVKKPSPKGASQPGTEGSSTVQPNTPTSIPQNLDPPPSLDKWATIHNSSSPRSGILMDQLQPSSPAHLLSADDDILSNGIDKQRTFLSSAPEDDQSGSGDAVTQANPLFILSNSQVAFPYSQWQDDGYANQAEDSPTESESEDEVPIKSKTKIQPHAPSLVAPKFRRLTDIASQAMFSQDILSSTPFPPTPVVTNKPQKLSDDSDEDEDDGDDTGSDSDTPVKSHIPKSRRAGATLRSKKGGLLSFT